MMVIYVDGEHQEEGEEEEAGELIIHFIMALNRIALCEYFKISRLISWHMNIIVGLKARNAPFLLKFRI